MTENEFFIKFKQKFSNHVSTTADKSNFILFDRSIVTEVIQFTVESIFSGENYFLEFITAVDMGKSIDLLYVFRRVKDAALLQLRTELPEQELKIESQASLLRSAYYYEKEIAEMFGIEFINSVPNQFEEGFLLPSQWQGNPLRKSYSYPNSFEGIEHQRAAGTKEYLKP